MNYCMHNIYKSFDGLKVLKDINICFDQNKVTCILGPSGCGKTTLLNIITSIIKPDSGVVEGFNGKKMSFIFQEDRLIEWKTVEENIDFVLKDRYSKEERAGLIERYLKKVNLYDYRRFHPRKLSGGMRQRVNVARAFAYSSDLLIMDEPFKSLDIGAKNSLVKDFLALRREDTRTVIFVTHVIEEAILLGDKIVILSDRPATIKKVIDNPIPLDKRWEKNNATEQLHQQIVTELT